MTTETETRLISGLASIQATLTAQHDLLTEHGESLKAIEATLNGNGKPGLKQEVASHGSTIANAKKIFWIVVTPILAAVGSGLVVGSVYLIHLIK